MTLQKKFWSLKNISFLILLCIFLPLFVAFILFYRGTFRVSRAEVVSYVQNKISSCTRITDCTLLPGDILVRKYMTQRIWFIDKILNMFFTHSAMYLGDNQIFEVFGPEKNPQDDVQVLPFLKSDWGNADIKNFVIIRPTHYSSQQLESITNHLRAIAEDSRYRFGLEWYGPRYVTCANILFRELETNGVIRVSHTPDTITPDYLFWLAEHYPDSFQIVGYNIEE